MRHMEKKVFSIITYKQRRFYQQRSELDFDANRVEKAKTYTLTGVIYRYLKTRGSNGYARIDVRFPDKNDKSVQTR